MNHLKAIFVTFAVTVVMSGCLPEMTEKKIPEPVADESINKYTSSTPEQDSFMDVRVWVEKHKQVTKMNEQLKKQNAELIADNKRLMERFNSMKTNLELTEKELSDANDMLVEMRKELDGWKTNVLGFREEINYVHKEQIKALVKIMTLLGGEYEDPAQEE